MFSTVELWQRDIKFFEFMIKKGKWKVPLYASTSQPQHRSARHLASMELHSHDISDTEPTVYGDTASARSFIGWDTDEGPSGLSLNIATTSAGTTFTKRGSQVSLGSHSLETPDHLSADEVNLLQMAFQTIETHNFELSESTARHMGFYTVSLNELAENVSEDLRFGEELTDANCFTHEGQ